MALLKNERKFFYIFYDAWGFTSKRKRQNYAGIQNGRNQSFNCFRYMGRGFDVQQVSLVINYDLPFNKEMYIHRIGRSGRFGRKGIAINLVKDEQMKELHDIEKYYSITIDEMPNNINEYL